MESMLNSWPRYDTIRKSVDKGFLQQKRCTSDKRNIMHTKFTKISGVLYVLFSNKEVRQENTAQLHFPVWCVKKPQDGLVYDANLKYSENSRCL